MNKYRVETGDGFFFIRGTDVDDVLTRLGCLSDNEKMVMFGSLTMPVVSAVVICVGTEV